MTPHSPSVTSPEGSPVLSAPPEQTKPNISVVLLLLIVIALYAWPIRELMRPVVDNDVWWHLRTGEDIFNNRDVPRADTYSTYGLEKHEYYVAYSWLYDLAFYGFYCWRGLSGLLLFRIILCGVLLVAIHRFVVRREPRFWWATVLTALAFIALTNMLYERSWIFSMLFFLITLEVVLKLRDGTATWTVWLLPVVFALWVNVHVQFIYGLCLLGLACGVPLLDKLLKRPTSRQWADTWGSAAWKRLIVLTGLCVAATLLNPYGPRFYSVVTTYASLKVPYDVENEFKALTFRDASDWAFLILVLAGAAALGRRPRGSLFEALPFAGTAYASFKARRDIWLVMFVALAACTGLAAVRPKRQVSLAVLGLPIALLAAGLAIILVFFKGPRDQMENALNEEVKRRYPVKAVANIRDRRYVGPLFNEYDWGGYLIWALCDYPVSMDGRVHVHGDERLRRHTNTVRGFDWENDKELMTARLVLLSKKGPLPEALRLHPRFGKPVYEDDVAVVFVAKEP